jgi:hypothetical protein
MPQGPFRQCERFVYMEHFIPSLSAVVVVVSLIAVPVIVYGIGWFAARVTRSKK